MRFAALAIAICLSFLSSAPIKAATPKSQAASLYPVKTRVKKSKATVHKAPKRSRRPRNHTRTL